MFNNTPDYFSNAQVWEDGWIPQKNIGVLDESNFVPVVVGRDFNLNNNVLIYIGMFI